MKLFNKAAAAHYKINEKIEAGIVLSGQEVKAVREGHADITGSYVKILQGEAYVINSKIFPYKYARTDDYQETRSRKLLLHKKELQILKSRLETGGFTLVPTTLYTKGPYIKLEIALVKGKKQHEKREDIKKRDLQREAADAVKRSR